MSKINEEEKEIKTAAETETAQTEDQKPVEEAPEKGKKDRKTRKLEEKIAELEGKLQKAEEANKAFEEKLATEKNDYLRLLADVDNIKRKASEDRLDLIKTASADLIKGLLPVLDDCEQAMKVLENSADEAAKEGTSLIYKKLLDYLKGKGLEQIESLGKDFDTDEHEALTQMPAPSEDMKGKVIEVFQQGYRLNGKIIRFAKVIVGA